jgi:hypothetical protein
MVLKCELASKFEEKKNVAKRIYGSVKNGFIQHVLGRIFLYF